MKRQQTTSQDGSKLYTTDKLDRIYEKLIVLKGKKQEDGSILKTDGEYKLFCYEGMNVLCEGDQRLKLFPVNE